VAPFLVAAVALLSSCTGLSRVTEYGKDLKDNFVSTCTSDVRVGHGTTTIVELAPERYCGCVYDQLPDSGLSVDELKAYEAKVAKAKAGEDPPEMPSELRKAMAHCESQR
jgi:hypothetical protein